MYKMKEVREFVDTYNRHFLLNYKAEELLKNNINEAKFKYEMDIDTGARTQLVYGEISANTESEAQKKYDKLEADMEKKHRNATIEGGVFDGKNTTTTTGRGTATRKNI